MQVLISAGGKGKRLGLNAPKCLFEIEGHPLVYYQLRAFEESGVIERVLFSTDSIETSNRLRRLARTGALPRLKYEFAEQEYRNPYGAFTLSAVREFASKGPLIWSYSDMIFTVTAVEQIIRKYNETHATVCCTSPNQENDGGYRFERDVNGRVISYSTNPEKGVRTSRPFLFAKKDVKALIDSAISDPEINTSKLGTLLFGNSSVYIVDPGPMVNINYPEDVEGAKALLRRSFRQAVPVGA